MKLEDTENVDTWELHNFHSSPNISWWPKQAWDANGIDYTLKFNLVILQPEKFYRMQSHIKPEISGYLSLMYKQIYATPDGFIINKHMNAIIK